MAPKSELTNGQDSFAARVEARALEIKAAWDAKADRDKLVRARSLASRQLRDERTRAVDAIPENWEVRLARAGVTGLAQTWPGCPTAPDQCVALSSGFSIDPAGIYVTPPDGGRRQFVSSPVVALADHRYAALVKGEWTTIAVAPPPDRDFKGQHPRTVLEALSKAGVTFGPPVEVGTAGEREQTPAAAYVALWLFGSFAGALVGRPVRTLAVSERDRHLDAMAAAGAAGEGRQQLAGVLSRMPRDVRR